MNPDRRSFFTRIAAGIGVAALPTDTFAFKETETGQVTEVTMRRGSNTIFFIDVYKVNLEDLCAPNYPGKIVRCYGDPSECVRLFEVPNG